MTDKELYMQLGDLALTKLAEEIDEKTFNKKAQALVKQASGNQVGDLADEYIKALKMTDLREGLTPSIPRYFLRGSRFNAGKILSGGVKSALAYMPVLYGIHKLKQSTQDAVDKVLDNE